MEGGKGNDELGVLPQHMGGVEVVHQQHLQTTKTPYTIYHNIHEREGGGGGGLVLTIDHHHHHHLPIIIIIIMASY